MRICSSTGGMHTWSAQDRACRRSCAGTAGKATDVGSRRHQEVHQESRVQFGPQTQLAKSWLVAIGRPDDRDEAHRCRARKHNLCPLEAPGRQSWRCPSSSCSLWSSSRPFRRERGCRVGRSMGCRHPTSLAWHGLACARSPAERPFSLHPAPPFWGLLGYRLSREGRDAIERAHAANNRALVSLSRLAGLPCFLSAARPPALMTSESWKTCGFSRASLPPCSN